MNVHEKQSSEKNLQDKCQKGYGDKEVAYKQKGYN